MPYDSEAMKRIFSDNLKKYMISKGISQKDIVDKLGVPYATISSWVNGTRLPRMGKVQQLADFLEIRKSDLIEDSPTEILESEEDIATSIQCLTKEEFDLNLKALESIQKSLKKLNPTGTNEAAKRVEELTHIDKYKRSPFDFSSIAAHKRTDIEVTDEMLEHDMKIMEDEDF